MKRSILTICLACLLAFPGYSWLYPEHRDIAIRAISGLDSTHRKILEQLWALVRKGNEARLCGLVIDTTLGLSPQCLDYAAWPAIGGDHSCSPENMADIILRSDWIMQVAEITARLKAGLARSRTGSEKDNHMREADIKLLRADPEYVSRAGTNNAHFKLALPDINISASDYMDLCIKEGTPPNATGIYTWFHTSALEAASLLSIEDLTDADRATLALAILADEAFALHFLEDCFASGHVAGCWGNASQRKGTHDFYNAAGYQVATWSGERMVLMGDAYMRDQDEKRAAYTVRLSLEQVLDQILAAKDPSKDNSTKGSASPDTFNVCNTATMHARNLSRYETDECHKILLTTPAPGLASGAGAMPRVSSELGSFIGIATAFRGTGLNHGFSVYQNTAGFVPGLEIAVRIGLGMEGVLNEASDGLTFIDLGWRLDGASTMKVIKDSTLQQWGNFGAALPSRSAYFIRFRMPYYLIPGDLLILAPVLLFASPKALKKVATTAANGGLIPWQTKMITSIGSFQFILGREVAITFYGHSREPDAFLLPVNDQGDGVICSVQSTQLSFPIMEYKMARSYAAGQSADFLLQLYGGLDIPGKRRVINPVGSPFPELQNIWFAGLRIVFDYRHYFTKKN